MLQDEGKLNVADPVSKFIPEFAGLKMPSGKPANLTITRELLTDTSWLGEANGPAAKAATTLAGNLVPVWLAAPMQMNRASSEIHAERDQRRGPDCGGGQRIDFPTRSSNNGSLLRSPAI